MFSNAHTLRFTLINYISPCKLFEKLKTQLINNNYAGKVWELKGFQSCQTMEVHKTIKRRSRST
jgi:hypothetical protein